MEKIFQKLAFLLSITAIVMGLSTSCKKSQDGRSSAGIFSSNEFKTDSIKFDKSIKNGKTTGNVSLVFDFPTSGNENLLTNIREWMAENIEVRNTNDLSDGKKMINFYGNSLVDSLKIAIKDMEGEESKLYRNITIRKDYETNKFVTYTYKDNSYNGGAHGCFNASCATFRKSDGRKFGWDMFTNNGQYDIQSLIVKGLKKYYKVKSDTDLMNNVLMIPNAEEYTSTSLIPLPKTAPCFTKDGVLFIYQEYEITCYAAGAPQIVIPYSQLKGLLTVAASNLLEK